MKAFAGYKSEPSGKAYEQLPPGTYVAQIKAAKVDGHEPDETLILRLDIAEGEYEGYYTKRYMHDTKNEKSKYPAKYKGDFRIRIPNDDNKNAMYPESDKKRFKDAMWRIEHSNNGYRWEWDQESVDKLKGLTVGISVQQGTYNGSNFTKIARLEIADDVRKGLVKTMLPMAPRSDASYDPPIDQQTGFSVVEDSEVPF